MRCITKSLHQVSVFLNLSLDRLSQSPLPMIVLKALETSPYEKRAFMYIEILPWLQSKIERKSLAEIIKKRR